MARPQTPETVEAVKQAFEGAALSLGLTGQGRQALLGDPGEQLDRMGMFLAIVEHAGRLVGDPGAWLKAPNRGAIFEGKPPLEFVLEDPSKNLPSTLRHLRGSYGGWA